MPPALSHSTNVSNLPHTAPNVSLPNIPITPPDPSSQTKLSASSPQHPPSTNTPNLSHKAHPFPLHHPTLSHLFLQHSSTTQQTQPLITQHPLSHITLPPHIPDLSTTLPSALSPSTNVSNLPPHSAHNSYPLTKVPGISPQHFSTPTHLLKLTPKTPPHSHHTPCILPSPNNLTPLSLFASHKVQFEMSQLKKNS